MSNAHPSETLDILRLAPGGEGVGRLANGEVCFVAATAPGDRVEVGNLSRQGGSMRGQLLQVITPSPERRAPPCPYASRCGGCDFMHLEPDAQRRRKVELLEDVLVRIAGNPSRPSRIDVVTTGNGLGYRSRLRLHSDEQGQLGFLSARSHRVVAVDRCLVADDTLGQAIAKLSTVDALSKKRLSFCEQVELRSAATSPTLGVRLFPRAKAQLRPELYAPLFPDDAVVVVADTNEDHTTTQTLAISPELQLSVPLSAFTQVNHAINRLLVGAVVHSATERGRRVFLDVFAGAGNFSIPLLQAGLTGEALDSASSGILAARARARDLGLPFNGFNVGEARKLLEHFVKTRREFDFIVLDPPRQGAKSVLDAALQLHPRTIALIGCDPVTLARDLLTLTQRGARIETLTIFDMFPETHHFETLAIVDCDG